MGVFHLIHNALLNAEIICPEQVFVPSALPSQETLELAHAPEYVGSFLQGTFDEQHLRRIGFGEVTRSQTLIDRTLAEVAGTLLTAELALEHGLACNTAGGTHHAFPAHGSGFCILNDLAITAEYLLRLGTVQRVLILDLDVHQARDIGDGTAAIFQGRSDVFTLSVHAERNFPSRKQRSHLDVGLPDGTGDAEYLGTLSEVLPGILQSFRPDLVLYDAGVDPHEDDELGRLALTDEGLQRRELLVGEGGRILVFLLRVLVLVLDTCLGHGVPVAGCVGGGYHKDLHWLAQRHTFLHRAATQLWQARRL
ncbi:hypothetical protein N2152v2_000201 [Parachlorella kessleri]